MPLSINVGLSRKASKDFQSTGVSINIVAELDQALLARPDELQKQIDNLYAQAGSALDRHAGVPQPAPDQELPRRGAANGHGGRMAANGNGRNGRGANGNGNGHAARSNGGLMTDSQRRAILAIADRLGLDAEAEIRDVFGWELDQLSLKQASQVIDHLKGQQAGNGR